jgi:hypothetical protein
LKVTNQDIQKIRGLVMQRTHRTLSKYWPAWWRDLGGLGATGMKTLNDALRLVSTAPSDLALGFAFGFYQVRTSLHLLLVDGVSDIALAQRALGRIDFYNSDIAVNHAAFGDIEEPPFGPDYELWLHQAPNDFAVGAVCGHFCAYDEAQRSGVSIERVVKRLTSA